MINTLTLVNSFCGLYSIYILVTALIAFTGSLAIQVIWNMVSNFKNILYIYFFCKIIHIIKKNIYRKKILFLFFKRLLIYNFIYKNPRSCHICKWIYFTIIRHRKNVKPVRGILWAELSVAFIVHLDTSTQRK